jgi:hypothetical protein
MNAGFQLELVVRAVARRLTAPSKRNKFAPARRQTSACCQSRTACASANCCFAGTNLDKARRIAN